MCLPGGVSTRGCLPRGGLSAEGVGCLPRGYGVCLGGRVSA